MKRLVVRNGRVIDPSTRFDSIADVAVEDGIVREIAPSIEASAEGEFDASGLIVAPGFVDIHEHLREPGF